MGWCCWREHYLFFCSSVSGTGDFFFVTYPDIPMGGWVFVFAGGYGFVPLLFYPSSKTLWTAIDILMRPLEDEDFDESV